MSKIKIESWHENGNSIWFYIKGSNKSYSVPKEYVQSCQLEAVSEFKKKLKEMLDPN